MNDEKLNTYTITPYEGVGDFIFYKTPSEIKRKCGEPHRVEINNILKNQSEYRDACRLVYKNKKLAYIALNKHTNPVINNIYIYEAGSIEQLMSIDPNHLIGKTYINFRTLGICVGGFCKKRIPEGKLVIAYSKENIEFFDDFTTDD